MKNRKTLIVAFAVALLTGLVSARGAMRLGSNGFRFQMIPVDPGGNSSDTVAVANCAVRINQRNVLLHWTATPFSHIDDPEIRSDAFLSAVVTDQIGRINVSPRKVIDRTNVNGHDHVASIAMGIQGDGDLKIRMEVGITDQYAAAGRHCADVVLTVTGR